jgi:hypothetical protein
MLVLYFIIHMSFWEAVRVSIDLAGCINVRNEKCRHQFERPGVEKHAHVHDGRETAVLISQPVQESK